MRTAQVVKADRPARAASRSRISRVALRSIVDAVRQPAFLVASDGRLLHRNAAARRCFGRTPCWIASCGCVDGRYVGFGPPSWVRCVAVDAQTVLVLADVSVVDLEDAEDAPWVEHWRLPPRLARVAACLASGLSDKDIAERLELGYQTVRTYVKQVYRRTRLRNRTDLVRAVHSGVFRSTRRRRR